MDKKALILETAYDIFKKNGNVTAREIASSANVNVASINYYYGSKDNLINEILGLMLEELTVIMKEVLASSTDIETFKHSFGNKIYDFTEYAPGFFKYIVSLIINSDQTLPFIKDQNSKYVGFIRDFIKQLIRNHSKIQDEEIIEMKAIIFTTSLSVSLITSGAILEHAPDETGIIESFKTKEQFIKYINVLIDMVLKD